MMENLKQVGTVFGLNSFMYFGVWILNGQCQLD